MMTRFPGTCACGCRQAYSRGADVVRASSGWVLASCAKPAAPARPAAHYFASAAEILEILARAKAVAARVTAPAPTLPPGLARGSRPADVEDAGRVLPF
jgi:hypothetical protein